MGRLLGVGFGFEGNGYSQATPFLREVYKQNDFHGPNLNLSSWSLYV